MSTQQVILKNRLSPNRFAFLAARHQILVSTLVLSLFISSNTFSADYLDDAKGYLAKGEYKAAIIQLKNQLKETPDNATVRYMLGESYLKTGALKLANKELAKAYQLEPKNEVISLSYAEFLLLQRDYIKVNEVLSQPFRTAEAKLNVQIYKAYAMLGQNKISEAKKSFMAISQQTENADVYIGLAKVAIFEKDLKQAKDLTERALEMSPDNIRALITKAKISILNKDYDSALIIYDQLISKQPNNLQIYLMRADINILKKDWTGVRLDISTVLNKRKNHPYANYLMSRVQFQEKQYSKAQVSAQKVLNMLPRNEDAMLVLGLSHFGQLNYNQADKYLTQYLLSKPEDLAIQNVLANLYLAKKQPEQAILILEGLDERKREQSSAILLTLGTAYLLTGEHKKGVSVLNKAKSLSPDSPRIQKVLVDGQFKIGDIDGAISGLERMSESTQVNPETNYLLILTYLKKSNFQKAGEKLNEFIKKTPDDPALYNLKAITFKLKGDAKASIDAYNQALKVDNQYIPAYIGLAEWASQQDDLSAAKKNYGKVIQIDPKNVKA